MEFLTTLFMVWTLTFSQIIGLFPIGNILCKGTHSTYDFSTEPQVDVTVSSNNVVEQPVSENKADSKYDYPIGNYISLDLEGYASFDMPMSHYFYEETDSTSTQKLIRYALDDKRTKIIASYTTNISEQTDIPGYIVRDVIGIDTVTNNKQEEKYGDRTWMKVVSETQVNGLQPIVWYSTSSSGTSAVWFEALVYPQTLGAEFYQSMDAILSSVNVYSLGSTVFDTPTTGWYAENQQDDDTKGDSSGYRANTKANTVFKTRGGYIEGADIAADWNSMEIIIDGHKYKLPCDMSEFYDNGFKINDGKLIADDPSEHLIGVNSTYNIKITNDRGTVVRLTLLNDSELNVQTVNDCKAYKIEINADEQIDVNGGTTEKPKESEDTNESESTEATPNTDPNAVNEIYDDETGESIPIDEMTDEDWQRIVGMSKEEWLAKGQDTQKEEEDKPEKQSYEQPSAELSKEFEKEYAHEVILPGGITWDAYADDIVAYYGQSYLSKTSGNDNTVYLKWDDKDTKLVLRTGLLCDIKSISMSLLKD